MDVNLGEMKKLHAQVVCFSSVRCTPQRTLGILDRLRAAQGRGQITLLLQLTLLCPCNCLEILKPLQSNSVLMNKTGLLLLCCSLVLKVNARKRATDFLLK